MIAKVTVLTGVTLVAGLVTAFASFFLGQQVFSVVQTGDVLSPWVGFAVFCAWWLVILLVGIVLFRRRDA